MNLRVEQVLWSHPKAVTPVSAGQTVSLDVSPGWISGSPAVYEGDTRMEVGGTFLLTLADHYAAGEQQLSHLFGSISTVDEAWDARFVRTGTRKGCTRCSISSNTAIVRAEGGDIHPHADSIGAKP